MEGNKVGYIDKGLKVQQVNELARELSEWIDYHNREKDPLAQTLLRLIKLNEEVGEMVSELIAITNQNPRKHYNESEIEKAQEKLDKELMDIATTSLLAWYHRCHYPMILENLMLHIEATHKRAFDNG